MKYWIQINTIFAATELVQGLLIALWVYKRIWFVAALAASTFMAMLVMHVLSAMSVIATWLMTELRKTPADAGV